MTVYIILVNALIFSTGLGSFKDRKSNLSISLVCVLDLLLSL